MPRTVDPERYAARRDTILETVERLVSTKGYDAMTIGDVLDDVGISKGALYHYFGGKEELLGGLVARRIDRWATHVEGAAHEGGVPTERLRGMLRVLASAKSDDRELLVRALPVLYGPRNAALHVRVRRAAMERFLPVITRVIDDGARTGEFVVTSAPGTARVVLSLLQECVDTVSQHLLALSTSRTRAAGVGTGDLRRDANAYVEALHAVLGAAPGALDFLDTADLDGWARAAVRPPTP